MTRLTVGPFNRVEGDLEVQLDIADGRVSAARVNSPLYRGFEQILQGKDPRDTLVIAPRICGICSVSQSMAAAYALANASGVAMPPNGELTTNLVLACENLADHLSHFYLFFMPDFARPIYADRAWYPSAAQRFQALRGTAAGAVLPARAQFMHIMGLLAGKWPHSLSLQPGGTAKPVQAQERIRLLAILGAFRRFLERETFGDALEAVVALDSARSLDTWAASDPEQGDLRRFLRIADDIDLGRLGRATDRFMSYGAYPVGGKRLFRSGLWVSDPQPLEIASIAEDLTYSWMTGGGPLHPASGVTIPDADKADAYTWCKAPRLGGQVMEVGALARQVIDGHPLVGTEVGPGETAPVAVQHVVRSFDPCMVCTVH